MHVEFEGIRAGFHGPARDLFSLGECQASRREFVGAEPEDKWEIWRTLPTSLDHLERETGTIVEASAVRIGAAIVERGEELGDQIPVSTMDLHCIKACSYGPLGGRRKGGHEGPDTVRGERLWNDGARIDFLNDVGHS